MLGFARVSLHIVRCVSDAVPCTALAVQTNPESCDVLFRSVPCLLYTWNWWPSLLARRLFHVLSKLLHVRPKSDNNKLWKGRGRMNARSMTLGSTLRSLTLPRRILLAATLGVNPRLDLTPLFVCSHEGRSRCQSNNPLLSLHIMCPGCGRASLLCLLSFVRVERSYVLSFRYRRCATQHSTHKFKPCCTTKCRFPWACTRSPQRHFLSLSSNSRVTMGFPPAVIRFGSNFSWAVTNAATGYLVRICKQHRRCRCCQAQNKLPSPQGTKARASKGMLTSHTVDAVVF